MTLFYQIFEAFLERQQEVVEIVEMEEMMEVEEMMEMVEVEEDGVGCFY